MRRYRSIGLGLAVLSLISCAKSGVDDGTASTSDNAAPAKAKTSEVVVTGSIGLRAQVAEADAFTANAPPAPPPPPLAPGMQPGWSPPYHDVGRDKFTSVDENPFKIVQEAPVSTFSIDVDTASYSWVRASLNQNVLPQPAAVRTEEMINYFPYDYASPRSAEQPFSTNVAVMPSPWAPGPQARAHRDQGLFGRRVRRGRTPTSSS